MIDKSKVYRTRNGRDVRIYATDGVGCCAVHGAIYQPSGVDGVNSGQPGMEWSVTVWNIQGQHLNRTFDLIEVRPRHKRVVWVNVYDNEVIHGGWKTKERADECCHGNHRIACLRVELDFEEGEGL